MKSRIPANAIGTMNNRLNIKKRTTRLTLVFPVLCLYAQITLMPAVRGRSSWEKAIKRPSPKNY